MVVRTARHMHIPYRPRIDNAISASGTFSVKRGKDRFHERGRGAVERGRPVRREAGDRGGGVGGRRPGRRRRGAVGGTGGGRARRRRGGRRGGRPPRSTSTRSRRRDRWRTRPSTTCRKP